MYLYSRSFLLFNDAQLFVKRKFIETRLGGLRG
jgi:hypothetical protein